MKTTAGRGGPGKRCERSMLRPGGIEAKRPLWWGVIVAVGNGPWCGVWRKVALMAGVGRLAWWSLLCHGER